MVSLTVDSAETEGDMNLFWEIDSEELVSFSEIFQALFEFMTELFSGNSALNWINSSVSWMWFIDIGDNVVYLSAFSCDFLQVGLFTKVVSIIF